MRYSTPELLVLGSATVLVLGGPPGRFENGDSMTSQPPAGFAVGLDD